MKGKAQSVECVTENGQKKCKTKGTRRSLTETSKGKWIMQTVDDPTKFCSVVVDKKVDLESFPVNKNYLKPFSPSVGGVTLNLEGLVLSDIPYQIQGTSTSMHGYEITEYTADVGASTFTCCGNRLKTGSENFFAWAAQVGGVAGLLHTLFFVLSAADFGKLCSKKVKHGDDETKDRGRGSGGMEMVHVQDTNPVAIKM